VVPGRFKDYISTPKANDYRSIHTTVIGPGKQRVELQIRTTAMHELAEYGIAAHSLYKDHVGSPTEMLSRESGAYAWLRRTIELLAEGSNPEEFLEHTKLELFHDQVFCFSPKGTLIALPSKATPIDFAYAVHTDVGNTAVGCKINGKIAPLTSELVNGDEVEIIGLGDTRKTTVTGVEMFRKLLDEGQAGDNVGVLLRGLKREEVERGQVLAAPGSITPHKKFKAEVYVLTKEEGGRHTPFFKGYRPQFYFRTTDVTGTVELPENVEMVMPGDNINVVVELITPIAMDKELRFAIREGGHTVGAGVVTEIIE
jgi:hypothetical protein